MSNQLNWVPSIKYIGSTLQENNSMDIDIDKKRGSFIGKVHSLTQEFHFLDPTVKMRLIEIYCESFYGSNIWDLFGASCDKLFRAYNVTVRMTYQVPRKTHRYLIEPISECLHPKVFLASRFIKFTNSLSNCNKVAIRILANLLKNVLRTTYGNNIQKISTLCNVSIELLTPSLVKNEMRYFSSPENEEWRDHALKDLINVQNNKLELAGFNDQEIKEMINFLCTT